jgi:hypothetical protein
MVSCARFVRALVLGLAALALAGCTSSLLTRLAYSNAALTYNNLTPLLTWMADGYVDLTDAQEDQVRARLASLQQWHRANELPRYRMVLDSALAKAAGEFAADDLAPLYREVRADYYLIVARAVPDLAALLAGLEASQVTHMEGKFAEDNLKFERESIKGTPDERRRKRAHRFVDQLESWTGSLSREQREMVDARLRDLPDFSEEVLAERRFRQGEILALARAHPPRAEALATLKHVLVETDQWRRPEFTAKLHERDAKVFELIAKLSTTFTPEQRAALQDRIRGLIHAIDKLTKS